MKKIFTTIFLISILALFSSQAQAQNFNILPVCAESGGCGVCDFFDMLANATEVGLQILGATAFFFFILSGILLINSAGNSEKRGKALSMMKNTVIGVLLVFISWMIVNAIIIILITPSDAQGQPNKCKKNFTACLFENPWNQFCEDSANVAKVTNFCFDHTGRKPNTPIPAPNGDGWDKDNCVKDKTLDVSCVGKGDGGRCAVKKVEKVDSSNPISHYNAGGEYLGICLDQICQIGLRGTAVVKYHGKAVTITGVVNNSQSEPSISSVINSCDYLRAISEEKYNKGGGEMSYRCQTFNSTTPSRTKTEGNDPAKIEYVLNCIKDICPSKEEACCGYIRKPGIKKEAATTTTEPSTTTATPAPPPSSSP